MFAKPPLSKELYKYDFDLNRGDEFIADYLEKHFRNFISDIQLSATGMDPLLDSEFYELLKNNIPLIIEECDQIILILRMQQEGHIKEAYEKAFCLFDLLKDSFIHCFSSKDRDGDYFRMRKGDYRIKDGEDIKKGKSELFHIKKDKRNLIGAYRYSIPGFPCLYLANGFELCWYECGMPHQFSFCKMHLEENGPDALRLIDFSNRPVDFLTSMNCWLANDKNDTNEKQKDYKYLLNYILTYPIAASCSMSVENRTSKFVEEYVMPQLIMQWIRETDVFEGVKYKSSLNTSLVKGVGAVNVALPVREFRSDGLCENLTSKILVSDIGYFDVKKEFTMYAEHLDKIKAFRNKIIFNKYINIIHDDYIMEMSDLCETICAIYEKIMKNDNYQLDILFQFIDCIFDHIHRINKSKKSIVEEAIKKRVLMPPSMRDTISNEEIEKNISDDIDEFYALTLVVIHKSIAFDFKYDKVDNFEKI